MILTFKSKNMSIQKTKNLVLVVLITMLAPAATSAETQVTVTQPKAMIIQAPDAARLSTLQLGDSIEFRALGEPDAVGEVNISAEIPTMVQQFSCERNGDLNDPQQANLSCRWSLQNAVAGSDAEVVRQANALDKEAGRLLGQTLVAKAGRKFVGLPYNYGNVWRNLDAHLAPPRADESKTNDPDADGLISFDMNGTILPTTADHYDPCPVIAGTDCPPPESWDQTYQTCYGDCNGFLREDENDPDLDNDTIQDWVDNCPTAPNPFQENMDGDGLGDACDTDIDGDGFLNREKDAPLAPGADVCAAPASETAAATDTPLDPSSTAGTPTASGQDLCPCTFSTENTAGACATHDAGTITYHLNSKVPLINGRARIFLRGDGSYDLNNKAGNFYPVKYEWSPAGNLKEVCDLDFGDERYQGKAIGQNFCEIFGIPKGAIQYFEVDPTELPEPLTFQLKVTGVDGRTVSDSVTIKLDGEDAENIPNIVLGPARRFGMFKKSQRFQNIIADLYGRFWGMYGNTKQDDLFWVKEHLLDIEGRDFRLGRKLSCAETSNTEKDCLQNKCCLGITDPQAFQKCREAMSSDGGKQEQECAVCREASRCSWDSTLNYQSDKQTGATDHKIITDTMGFMDIRDIRWKATSAEDAGFSSASQVGGQNFVSRYYGSTMYFGNGIFLQGAFWNPLSFQCSAQTKTDSCYGRLYDVMTPQDVHWQVDNTDSDEDGVPNAIDNCPSARNPQQTDTDRDTLGDACDPTLEPDADKDNVPNPVDNCPLISNPFPEGSTRQVDTDRDGWGDACDGPNGVGPEWANNSTFPVTAYRSFKQAGTLLDTTMVVFNPRVEIDHFELAVVEATPGSGRYKPETGIPYLKNQQFAVDQGIQTKIIPITDQQTVYNQTFTGEMTGLEANKDYAVAIFAVKKTDSVDQAVATAAYDMLLPATGDPSRVTPSAPKLTIEYQNQLKANAMGVFADDIELGDNFITQSSNRILWGNYRSSSVSEDNPGSSFIGTNGANSYLTFLLNLSRELNTRSVTTRYTYEMCDDCYDFAAGQSSRALGKWYTVVVEIQRQMMNDKLVKGWQALASFHDPQGAVYDGWTGKLLCSELTGGAACARVAVFTPSTLTQMGARTYDDLYQLEPVQKAFNGLCSTENSLLGVYCGLLAGDSSYAINTIGSDYYLGVHVLQNGEPLRQSFTVAKGSNGHYQMPNGATLSSVYDGGILHEDSFKRRNIVLLPSYMGTAEAGAEVRLLDGTQVIAKTRAGSNGRFSFFADQSKHYVVEGGILEK